MAIDNEYYRLRNVSEDFYQNYSVPIFIRSRMEKNQSILDFGCGYGQLLLGLNQLGFTDLCGLDINIPALEVCKKNNLTVTSSIDELILAGKKFDWVVCSHVIEHIPKKEVISTLTLIREKLLAPDGRFFVMVPNAMSNTGCYWRYEDWTHETLFTPGSLLYVLKAAGFSNVEFIDPDCTEGSRWDKKIFKQFFLYLYRLNIKFWNRITTSSYHQPSPQIYSYELKAVARR
ncbi:class I SAM-dependent methyltransferase [bacterium]|nr:class I SAM-dependent methyltransferase [bacterium]